MPPAETSTVAPSSPSRVQLWLVDLAASAEAMRACADRLGPPFDTGPGSARTPAATPVLEAKALARLALRLTLSRLVGPGHASRAFVINPGGKPALASRSPAQSTPVPAFSLSHADHGALIAIAPSEPIGVDFETIRPLRLADHRRVLLEEAARALVPSSALPGTSPDQRFIQAWVRLEAFAKATGEGIGHLLGRIRESAGPPLEPAAPDGTPIYVRDLAALPIGGILHPAALAGTDPCCDPAMPAPPVEPFPADPDQLWHWLTSKSPERE